MHGLHEQQINHAQQLHRMYSMHDQRDYLIYQVVVNYSFHMYFIFN